MKNYLSYVAIHAVDHCNQSCVNCNNHSVFFKKKQYEIEDYSKWMDILIDKGMLVFGTLSIIGGEPFLHSELEEFIMGFKKRYDPMNIQIITNGFWMKSEKEIEKRSPVLEIINRLIVTRYPNLMPKERFFESLEIIRNKHQFSFNESVEKGHLKDVDCNLEVWEVDKWCSFEFLDEPKPVESFCEAQANCTQILSDGRLARCATAAYADKNPLATVEFLENRKDIFFDIKNDKRSILEWRYKWPMDACHYCTMWKCKDSKWKNDPSIRKTPRKLF